ncbi:MAG: helix-turn-helix domain-containing protein, partial [Myxococcota bacterium]
FDLLLALIARKNEVVSRTDLMRDVWGYNAAVVSRTVDSHIGELRQAIEADLSTPQYIHTVWKSGYRFSP